MTPALCWGYRVPHNCLKPSKANGYCMMFNLLLNYSSLTAIMQSGNYRKRIMNNDINFTSVDTLGLLLAQIADLTKQADAIKDSIKDSASAGGSKVVEGAMFKATYTESNRSVVDNKSLLAELGATADQIARHTKTTAVFSVKVTSR